MTSFAGNGQSPRLGGAGVGTVDSLAPLGKPPVSPVRHPVLEGRHVRLRQVEQRDLPVLYSWVTLPAVGYRWRLGGATPSPDEFAASLWKGTVALFAVERRDNQQLLGITSCLNPDHRNRFAFAAALFGPSSVRRGWPLEGVAILIRYVFTMWDFRKLYFETPAFTLEQFGSAVGRLLHLEGRFRQHEYYDGAWHDMFVLALYRDEIVNHPLARWLFGEGASLGGSAPSVDQPAPSGPRR